MVLRTFPLQKFQFLSGTNILYSKFCTGVWIVALSCVLAGIGVEACHGAGPWQPPRLESTNLFLVLISLLWELLLLWCFFPLWNIFHHSLIHRCSLQNWMLFYRLQKFYSVCTGSILSLRHCQFLTEKQGTWEIPWTEEAGALTVYGVATESDATEWLAAVCAHGSHFGSSWMVLTYGLSRDVNQDIS